MDGSTRRDYISEALAVRETDVEAAIAIATEGIHANLEKELGYGPEKSYLYAIRSTFYECLKNYDAAIEDTSKVISICVKYPEAGLDIGESYARRGYLFRMKGDFQMAIEDYTAAIAANPGYYRHYLLRGLNKLSLADNESALDDFRQAFQLAEKDALGYQWLVDFLANHDKTE
jgi:tetratricopeptide (TPR) repeat protein